MGKDTSLASGGPATPATEGAAGGARIAGEDGRPPAVAALGGTALAGGSGTILGGLLGALVLAILVNGFTLAGVNAFTFDLILGIAIVLAMIANVHLARLRRAGRV